MIELMGSIHARMNPSHQLYHLTLANLFDFSVDYRVKASEATGSRGLHDELDLYELIDLDASGESDTDV
jgi:hypothetical protein